jgi:HPt (histidine-containing phosphotransfer) domain-containing protein
MISQNLKLPSTDSLGNSFPAGCLDLDLGLDMVGDAQALDEVLALAEQSLTHDLPAIAQLLGQGDAGAASRVLHSIKGFVPIFCVQTLVQHVTRVELLSKTASAAELQPAYAELEPVLRQLCEELRRHLKIDPPVSVSDASP